MVKTRGFPICVATSFAAHMIYFLFGWHSAALTIERLADTWSLLFVVWLLIQSGVIEIVPTPSRDTAQP